MSSEIARSPVTPNDTDFDKQWGLTEINCPEAWTYTTGDDSIIVAVLDTGVAPAHPDLQGRLLPGHTVVTRDGLLPGYSWVDPHIGEGSAPIHVDGHGTQVAGIIGACTNNSLGIAGITWQSKILPVKVAGLARRDRDGM